MAKHSTSRSLTLSLLSALSASAASGQTLDQSITFGDSTVDSGFYKALPDPGGSAAFNALWPAAVAAGAGKPTTSPGPVYSQALVAQFGLTAKPANQPGGTDFATSGAKDVTVNTMQTGGFLEAIPTTTQIADYLAAVHRQANPNALYLISSGGNDVSFALGDSGTGPFPPDPSAYLKGAADSLASSIGRLHAAGARYIVVPDLPFSFPTGSSAADANERSSRLLYSKALWGDLAGVGVNFIPADINAVRLAILAKPSAFGFQFIDTAHPACTQPAGINSAWALLCSSNPAAPSQLVSSNAEQTHLFADDQHLTTAGQKIIADYIYSIIIAPSEISLLAEGAIKDRTRSLLVIRNQIDASEQQRGPSGVNAWVTGDIARLKIDNPDTDFPGDAGDPRTITAGIDYKWFSGLLTGAAIGVENQTSDYDAGGNFTQHEVAGSLYAAYSHASLWGDVIGTYGGLNFDVNRMVPVGITIQPNAGKTDGNNPSASIEGGYRFGGYSLTHGPVVGFTWQRVDVGAFTESGSFTSLSFGHQTRDSGISELGYRVSFDIGGIHPFAQAAWNHEFDDDRRSVTAALTTVAFAPSYSMPAVDLGKDWGTADIGATVNVTSAMMLVGAFTSEFGDHSVVTYGGQLGLNLAF